ncbi:DUF4175 family protein [Lignipirellula cremea]|uniref:Uncharacterized protein n=1 Tax=Lignipirellula cremea TaxID=2528010 RepID=A0A518DY89_9BACT|nr:DUF4175 family protein [Lignipirellula cremea]QDU96808.1 hypothetical protein Pla8534_46290 [Lignipirellula cremea]
MQPSRGPVMHPLEKKVNAIGDRARRLLLLYGAALTLAVFVGAALLLGLVDYWSRLEDLGLRLICSAALLVSLVAGWWFLLRPVLRRNFGTLYTARQIERSFPQLKDRLSSTIAFLQQSEQDPTAGSLSLRKAVVSQTTAEVERLPLNSALNGTLPRRMAWIAAGVCLATGVVCLLDTSSAAQAAWRLAAPWNAPAWPKRHQLEIVDPPDKIAAGEDLEIRVVDRRGKLPSSVTLEYQVEGESADTVQSVEMFLHDDQMEHRLNHVARSLRYRAVGGDDDTMPWHTLEVVDPPGLTASELTILPPAYTGWKPYQATSHLRVLADSRIEIRGTADRPLSAARVLTPGENKPIVHQAVLSPNRLSFELLASSEPPWIAERSGSYRLELVDQQGIASGASEKWNLRVVPDTPPTASIDAPSSSVFVTANAIVPLSARVKDDLLLAQVELVFRRAGVEEPVDEAIVLAEGPEQPEPGEAVLSGDGDNRVLAYAWDLASLSDLTPGDSLEARIRVVDYKQQQGESGVRRLTIISTQEFEDRLAQRRTYILSQLGEILARQRVARGQTQSLEIQIDQVGNISGNDIDLLQGAELNQRQVRRLLAGDSESIVSQIENLLSDLRNNRIDSSDTERTMTALLEAVQGLEAGPLPQVSQNLITGLKNARDDLLQGQPGFAADPVATPVAASAGTIESLHSAGRGQDAVIAVLEELQGELSQWDNYRRLAREVARIQTEQGSLLEATEQQRIATLTRQTVDLSEQEKADLTKLSQQQLELSRRVEKLQSRMRQMEGELRETDPLAAETVADALDVGERLAISAQMRESGRQLERNQIAQSAAVQKEANEGLQELLEVLSNRRAHELGRIAENLSQAASELGELQKTAEQLRQQTEQAQQEPDEEKKKRTLERLAKEQKELAEKTHRLARRLERLQAQAASQSLSQASQSLSDAGEAGGQGDAGQAEKKAAQAESELEEAEQQLQQAIAAAEKELLEEQLAQLETALSGMIGRQQRLLDETLRLDRLASDQGQLDRAEKASINTLALAERVLADEVGALSRKTAESAAFQLGLDGAAREMQRAAGRLDRQNTGAATQQSEQAALQRLQQVVDALKPAEPTDPAQPPAEQGGGGDGPAPSQPEGAIERLAELRLLKSLQEAINSRTLELENLRRQQGDLAEEEIVEANELAEEQGRLADLIINLSQPVAPPPEENPDQLPDLNDLDLKGLDDLDLKGLEDLDLKGLDDLPPPAENKPASSGASNAPPTTETADEPPSPGKETTTPGEPKESSTP